MIFKWVGQPQPPVAADAASVDWRTALAGIDGLDCTRGVSVVRGRWPTYLRILRTFVSTQGDAGPKLERALAEGRLNDVEHLAHALKGSAGNIGALEGFRDGCRRVLAIRAGGDAEAAAPVARLVRALQPLLTALRQRRPRRKMPHEPASPVCTVPVGRLLRDRFWREGGRPASKTGRSGQCAGPAGDRGRHQARRNSPTCSTAWRATPSITSPPKRH